MTAAFFGCIVVFPDSSTALGWALFLLALQTCLLVAGLRSCRTTLPGCVLLTLPLWCPNASWLILTADLCHPAAPPSDSGLSGETGSDAAMMSSMLNSALYQPSSAALPPSLDQVAVAVDGRRSGSLGRVESNALRSRLGAGMQPTDHMAAAMAQQMGMRAPMGLAQGLPQQVRLRSHNRYVLGLAGSLQVVRLTAGLPAQNAVLVCIVQV